MPDIARIYGGCWTNRATHRILTAHAKDAQLTTSAPTATPAGTQQWKFSS